MLEEDRKIKPIETYYNGYRFRSRLEARWAVFFDAIGIKYEYEPEGFEMFGVKYLPDFYLPDNKRWIEIKSKKLTADELRKCDSFCEAAYLYGLKFNFSIFIGQPFDNIYGIKINKNGTTSVNKNPKQADILGIKCHSYEPRAHKPMVTNGDKNQTWNESIVFFDPDLCEEDTGSRFLPMFWSDMRIEKEDLVAGTLKARQARFEHGENPKGSR